MCTHREALSQEEQALAQGGVAWHIFHCDYAQAERAKSLQCLNSDQRTSLSAQTPRLYEVKR